jgi:excisionase family DNA binding protein
MIPTATETPTMTVEEAGALLGISRSSAYEACRRGEIPALRIGSRWIIPTISIRAMLGLDAE